MKIQKYICNLCGKETDAPFSIQHQLEYGSIYDGAKLEFELCQECTDTLISELNQKKIYPIIKEN